jgi:hypothetical protein
METTNNPETGTGLSAATDAFEAILTGPTADTTNPTKPERNVHASESDEDDEALESEDESTTPEYAEDEESDAEAEDTEQDTDDEDEAPASFDPKTTKVTVQMGDKAEEVTVEELTRGYQRQSDYTKKTQALAIEHKAVAEARTEYFHTITLLRDQLDQWDQKGKSQAELEELRQYDPTAYLLEVESANARKTHKAAADAELERIRVEQQKERRKVFDERRTAARIEATATFPGWKDEAKLIADSKRMEDLLKSDGMTGDEIETVGSDIRLMRFVWKAMRYDRLMAAKPKPTQAPVKQGPKVMAPSSKAAAPRAASAESRVHQRLAKTGKMADAASVFETMLTKKK